MAKILFYSIDRLTYAIPLPAAFFEMLWKPRLITLNYHVVSDASLPHIRHMYQYKNVKSFNSDLLYLKKNYRVVSYKEVVDGTAFDNDAARIPVLITFDDSFVECYSVVAPILKEFELPAVFFLITDLIDNRKIYRKHLISVLIEKILALPLQKRHQLINTCSPKKIKNFGQFKKWLFSLKADDDSLIDSLGEHLSVDVSAFLREQQPYLTQSMVRELVRAGHTIGAHSCSHPHFKTLSQEKIKKEILDSVQLVREWTGQVKVPFSFPFNGDGVDREFLRRLGQNSALELFFDSKDFNPDAEFVFNRIWTDSMPLRDGHTNLPHLLRVAYLKRIFYTLIHLFSI